MRENDYSTSTNESFLQALGPYRVRTSSEPLIGSYYTESEVIIIDIDEKPSPMSDNLPSEESDFRIIEK